LGRAAGGLYFSLRNTLRLFFLARSRGEIAMAGTVTIESVRTHGVRARRRLACHHSGKLPIDRFQTDESAAAVALFADGGELICVLTTASSRDTAERRVDDAD
jgi:hypothetical protein